MAAASPEISLLVQHPGSMHKALAELSLVTSTQEINSFQREEVTWDHGFSASRRRHKALLKAEK